MGASFIIPRRGEVMRRRSVSVRLACLLPAALLATGGCGIYSTRSGRVREDVRSVAVPYLENRSTEPGIEIELTDEIIAAIQDDNTLKVVDEESADSILSGAVTRYALKEAYISQNQQVDEYQVQITVKLDFQVKATGEYIFKDRVITGTGNYMLEGGGADETTARQEAAAQIVRDVLGSIVEGW